MTSNARAPLHASAAEEPVSLAKAPVGWRRRVLHIDEAAGAELAREGLLAGSVVVVTARTPLGGPVVVELGRARLALAASVAALVLTVPYVETAVATAATIAGELA